jgi:hypothetical protein
MRSFRAPIEIDFTSSVPLDLGTGADALGIHFPAEPERNGRPEDDADFGVLNSATNPLARILQAWGLSCRRYPSAGNMCPGCRPPRVRAATSAATAREPRSSSLCYTE